MAERMANVVAMTSKFQQQMEARDKREAEKDAQIVALMQQVKLLASTMAELTKNSKATKQMQPHLRVKMGGQLYQGEVDRSVECASS